MTEKSSDKPEEEDRKSGISVLTIVLLSLACFTILHYMTNISPGSHSDNKHSDWSEVSEEVPKTADDTEKKTKKRWEKVMIDWGGGWGSKFVSCFASYL